jgi:hypothetical protein
MAHTVLINNIRFHVRMKLNYIFRQLETQKTLNNVPTTSGNVIRGNTITINYSLSKETCQPSVLIHVQKLSNMYLFVHTVEIQVPVAFSNVY